MERPSLAAKARSHEVHGALLHLLGPVCKALLNIMSSGIPEQDGKELVTLEAGLEPEVSFPRRLTR